MTDVIQTSEQLTRQQLSKMLDEYRMIFARAVTGDINDLDKIVKLHQQILDEVFR